MIWYRTVLSDPPWGETGGGKIRRGADRHYPLMKTQTIIEYMLEIPIDSNAHLYLWVTNSFLPDGLKVMNALGFSYKTNLVWVKDRFGLGQYFRGQHELLLFGVKGSLPYKSRKKTITTVIRAKRKRHSQKPAVQYSIIEATSYPPYLEVFGRGRREGWHTIGLEIPNTIQTIF